MFFQLAQKCGERQLSEARGEAGAGKVCVEEPAEAENTRWMWMKQNLRGEMRDKKSDIEKS